MRRGRLASINDAVRQAVALHYTIILNTQSVDATEPSRMPWSRQRLQQRRFFERRDVEVVDVPHGFTVPSGDEQQFRP